MTSICVKDKRRGIRERKRKNETEKKKKAKREESGNKKDENKRSVEFTH